MIQFRSLLRPISVAKLLTVLSEASKHDHHDAALLPDHLPEVRGGMGEGSSGCDVCRVARIVVGLTKIQCLRTLQINIQFHSYELKYD